MKFTAIIIEDELLARQRLKLLLEKFKDTIEIIAEAENGYIGLEKINSLKPDLIFLDIQMPGLTGFEMLNHLDKMPLVIFTTAYDEYALQAFDTNAIDYLLKPVTIESMQHAIDKLQEMTKRNGKFEERMIRFLQMMQPEQTYIKVKSGAVTKLISYDDIMYFAAEDKYTCLHTEKKKYYINDSLNNLEKKLPGQFKRIHRSAIINVTFVKEILQLSGNKSIIIMKDDTELPVSRRMRKFL